MLDKLLTEQSNPASVRIDVKSSEEILRIINQEDQRVAAAVSAAIPEIAKAVDEIEARIRKRGRLFYVGAGTSGRLGVLDAVECRPTFNAPEGMVQGILAGGAAAMMRAVEGSEDSADAGAGDLRAAGLTANDAVVGIAASGRTPYVLGAVDYAKSAGAFTAGISCTPASELSSRVGVAIELLTGPEVITGSTRMKAGTATKLALNMISTAVMIRLGFVYGNLMVNVQPANEKLRARARRIVSQLGGVDEGRASLLLEAAGNNVRAAILMGRRGLDAAAALALLDRAGGRLAEALEWTNS
jgi:N-acetylmuramic acid 6-phosphate etherase